MKVTIDTDNKTVELEGDVNLDEFFQWCNVYLKDWTSYKLVEKKVVNAPIYPYTPYIPTIAPYTTPETGRQWWENPFTISSTDGTRTDADIYYKVDIKAPQNN